MKTFLSVLVLVFIFCSSCKKDKDDPGGQPGGGSQNVYIAGSDKTGDGSVPCFWKNDTRTNLSNSKGGDAYSISVNGSNVYVAGRHWLDNAQTRFSPCYWLNANRTDLPLLDPRGNGMAKSILAFDGTVYAAGTCSDSLEFFANSGWRNLPVYWKNGQIMQLKLLDGFGNGSAVSIALQAAPNRVITYIAGTSYASSGYDEPCYWKIDPFVITIPGADIEPAALSSKGFGGSALNLSPGSGNNAQGDIYIAGFIDNADGINEPCYWHNGTRTDLSKINPNDHGAATAVDYAGSDVYVVGYCSGASGRIPCIWKNGARTELKLPAGTTHGEATAVKVHEGNVYVAGTVNASGEEFPCYWKNGEISKYNSKGVTSSIALSK